jgi:hypothetical protein
MSALDLAPEFQVPKSEIRERRRAVGNPLARRCSESQKRGTQTDDDLRRRFQSRPTCASHEQLDQRMVELEDALQRLLAKAFRFYDVYEPWLVCAGMAHGFL